MLSLSFIQKVLSIRHNRTTSPRTPYSTHSLCVLFSFFLFSTFFSFPTTTNHTRLKHQTRRCKEIVEKNALFARSIYTLHIPSISHTFSTSPPVIRVRSFSNFCPLVYYPSSLFVELSPTTFPPLPIHFPSFLFRPHTRLDLRVALHSHRWTTLKQLSLLTTLLTALIST